MLSFINLKWCSEHSRFLVVLPLMRYFCFSFSASSYLSNWKAKVSGSTPCSMHPCTCAAWWWSSASPSSCSTPGILSHLFMGLCKYEDSYWLFSVWPHPAHPDCFFPITHRCVLDPGSVWSVIYWQCNKRKNMWRKAAISQLQLLLNK